MIAIIGAAFGVICCIIATRWSRRAIVLFLARYGIVFFSLFFLENVLFTYLPSFHIALRDFTAAMVGKILTAANISHSVSGSTVTLQNPFYAAFKIDTACLGSILFWVYASLVLADLNATAKQRVRGILIGFAIILAFNFFRIVMSIYLAGRIGVNVHNYFYYFNFVFVLLLWAGWLWTIKPKKAQPPKKRPQQTGADTV